MRRLNFSFILSLYASGLFEKLPHDDTYRMKKIDFFISDKKGSEDIRTWFSVSFALKFTFFEWFLSFLCELKLRNQI